MTTSQLNKLLLNLPGRKALYDGLYRDVEAHPGMDFDQLVVIAAQAFLGVDDIEALVEEIKGELFPPSPGEIADERRLRRWENERQER